ncbi:MAG: hypothetical protein K9G58_06505 [Bacteroidales bacterium]|nr:hypothetical protein [Bacteroidales bacterium]MCF8386456.1 hypothetical protein [Bacteroidales bacterium]MCF8397800.1 hypothetical protein [Bacteroidales bacterium]
MKFKGILKVFLVILISGISLNTFSQTLNEAGDAYNKGVQATKAGNFDEAIQAHLNCISIAEQLGAEGDDLKLKAMQQLAKQYLNAGIEDYKAKDYNGAIQNFQKSSEYASKVNDINTQLKADNYLAVFYSSFGMSNWKKDKFDKAMDYFNKSLAIDPSNTKSLLGVALVYKSQGDEAKMKETVDKLIVTGPANDKYVQQGTEVAYKYYLAQGAKKIQGKAYSEAIDLFNTSMEYHDANESTYYYLAVAYNANSNWDKALGAAEKGLTIADKNKSNLYFEKAKALEGKGDVAAACEAYQSVTDGPNLEAAKYKIETELKCN